MLLYPESGLAFIHVPKNGGKSIRRALDEALAIDLGPTAADLGITPAQLHDMLESGDGVPHGELGQVKLEHLPLVFWQRHFPLTWAAFTQLEPFVLVREPRDRFLSSVLQRLGEFKDVKGVRADDPQVTQEALLVCEWLEGRGAFCDPQYIHFTRQIDYVEIDGERLVQRIFPIEQTDAATRWMRQQAGLVVAVSHDHARREPKSWARSIQPVARFIGRNLVPPPLKRAIYPLWINSGIFGDASARYKEVALSPDVERFIARHYAADAALYSAARGQAAPAAAA